MKESTNLTGTNPMIIRPKTKEGKSIQKLINSYASDGSLLPLFPLRKSMKEFEIFLSIRSREKLLCRFSSYNMGRPGELRSLAVQSNYQRQGIGTALVMSAIDEARDLQMKKIFLLTNQKEFFEKLGFQLIDKLELPHKVWSDCVNCIKFPDADEVAMILKL